MATPTDAQLVAIRREAIGSADDRATLSDDDLTYFWEGEGAANILLTAALACEQLAAVAAGNFRHGADGQSIDMTMLQKQYQDRADRLRWRASTGGTATLTRVGAVAGDEFA